MSLATCEGVDGSCRCSCCCCGSVDVDDDVSFVSPKSGCCSFDDDDANRRSEHDEGIEGSHAKLLGDLIFPFGSSCATIEQLLLLLLLLTLDTTEEDDDDDEGTTRLTKGDESR